MFRLVSSYVLFIHFLYAYSRDTPVLIISVMLPNCKTKLLLFVLTTVCVNNLILTQCTNWSLFYDPFKFQSDDSLWIRKK